MTDVSNEDLEPSPASESREERIRTAAYRRFIDTGGTGDELTDWLEAEAEIDAEDAELGGGKQP